MENFVVSARKYRPTLFNEVVGQQAVTETLKKAICGKRFAHAYLFCGPRGIGKTTCARILAKAINCKTLTDEGEPCNKCESCTRFRESASFNIYELDAASNNSVEDMRSLIEQVRFPPQDGKYKVYVIDEVHMLSQQAFNAFLKTLEEPPAYAVFILATTEKHKIIPTILSRCQIYDFNRIKTADIVNHLKEITSKEDIKAAPDALHIIAQKADGALRDALSIYDKVVSFSGKEVTYEQVLENLNILDHDYYFKVTDALFQQDGGAALQVLNTVITKGFEGDDFINGLNEHFRNLLVCQDPRIADLLEGTESLQQRYKEQAGVASPAFLLSALNIGHACDVSYQTAKNKRLHVEVALLKMAHIPAVLDMDKLADNNGKRKEPTAETDETSKKKPTSLTEARTSEKTASAKTYPSEAPPEKRTVSQDQASTARSDAPDNKAPASGSGREENGTTDHVSEPQEPVRSFKPIGNPGKQTGNSNNQSATTPQARTETDTPVAVHPECPPLDEKKLCEKWQAYANDKAAPKSHFLKNLLLASKPAKTDEHTFEVKVANQADRQKLEEESLELLSYLRKAFNNPDVKMTVIVDEATAKAAGKVAYTDKEKFQYMAEKNPALQHLKKTFDLDIKF